MAEGQLQRAQILLEQSRYQEASKLLQDLLNRDPENYFARYLYGLCCYHMEDYDRAREISDQLLAEYPTEFGALELSIMLDLEHRQFPKATSKAELLIENYPEESDAYVTMARLKYVENNYDASIHYSDIALSHNPENVTALNLKIICEGIIGKKSHTTIEEALSHDPENAFTIANHAIQLTRENKVLEALERAKYALSIDPTNDLAKEAMKYALKARFWPYRMFLKLGEWQAKLSANGSWGFIIGAYILYRVIIGIAESNEHLAPFLYPIVYLIFGLFILTWVFTPLMNLYLLTNKYGKLLLTKKEKTMAKGVGVAFVVLVLSVIIYLATGLKLFLYLGGVGLFSMIPLGSYLVLENKKKTKILTYYTFSVIAFGVIGALTQQWILLGIFGLGVFAYQWIINSMLIQENARVI